MKSLRLELFAGTLTSAPGDTVVVPVPTNERPLRADAGLVDWRLRGEISQQLLSNAVTGALHEAILLPAPPPLMGTRLMLIGIGPCETLPGRGVQDAFRDIAQRLLALRSDRAVMALPKAIDLTQDAGAALRGCLQILSVRRGAGDLCLLFPGTPTSVRALSDALDEVSDDARRRQVHLGLSWNGTAPDSEDDWAHA